jgi:ubiquinone/menaquinone biosynthesis C-methylase UbiE
LDLPCGAGYLTQSIVDAGFVTTGADVSQHMVELAEAAWESACQEQPDRRGKARFVVQDIIIMETTFPDEYFDAVVCNRLFHHFYEPAMRLAALTELRRICSGPVVVFYFDRFALDSLRLATLRAVFGKFRRDRIPISSKVLAAEAEAAGLKLDRILWTRRGISPQAYAVFRPTQTTRHLANRTVITHDATLKRSKV